jgi:hypothetical protein
MVKQQLTTNYNMEITNVELFLEYINNNCTKEKLSEKYNLNVSVIDAKISYGREQYYDTNYWNMYLKNIINN